MKSNKMVGIAAAALLSAATLISPAAAFEAKLSGQVNQLVMWADDGTDDDVMIGDNNNSSTRIAFKGQEAFGAVKAGVYIELELVRNSSKSMFIEQNSDGDFTMDNADRWLEAYFDTPYGKFQIGKGDGASNNVSEQDLSGTSVITKSDANATAGSMKWRYADGSYYGTKVKDSRNNFDGLSRVDRIRYTTPDFHGLTVSSSAANGGAWDVGAFYAAEYAGNKFAAAIGYSNFQDRDNDDETYQDLGMSVSWLAPFGLNVTLAYGQREYEEGLYEDLDPVNYYVKVGYKYGIHAFSIDYGQTKDLKVEGEKSSNWGVAYVVKPWKPVELFAAYRQYSLDADSGDDPEDIQQILAGTRIKF